MLNFRSLFSIVTLTFVIFLADAQAQTRYVTDSFEIMMRTGPSVKKKIIKALKSGVRVEIIEADSGNSYSKVKIDSGQTGYVLTRYLNQQEPAKDRVVYLEGVLEKLKAKPEELQSLLVSSQEQSQALLNENTQLKSDLSNISEELRKLKQISGNEISLANSKQSLESERQQLLLSLDEMRLQNKALKDNADYVRNLTMTGILLLGLFLGWVLSRYGKQRRNSWGS